MTLKSILLSLCCLLFIGQSCVRKKIYKAELTHRQQCEARESVLNRELADRKSETQQLIDRVGELSKDLGRKESEIAELRAKIVSLSNSSTQNNTRLTEEITALNSALQTAQSQVNELSANLKRIETARAARQTVLQQLKSALDTALVQFDWTSRVESDHVELLMPDQQIFEGNGLSVTQKGRSSLEAIAQVMLNRPTLSVEIITYTDNKLPKNAKNLTDTWDWSLQRATNLVRILVADYTVNANQLTPIGKGEFYPVATNETPEGRAQNRRTIIIFKP
jgi:chemotaxis protein MotB